MSATADEIEAIVARAKELWARGERALAHEELGRAYKLDTGHPLVLSWYGMTTAVHGASRQQGLMFCEEAVRRAGPAPELLVNVARAALASQARGTAARALYRALDEDPMHAEALALLKQMGLRRPPVIPFLPRHNPINKALGKIRHRMARKAK